MAYYVKNYIEQLQRDARVGQEFLKALKVELERLDPRDFEPAYQAEIVWARAEIQYVINMAPHDHEQRRTSLFYKLLNALDHYKGEGSRAARRTFPYIDNPQLRSIIERDYAELRIRLFPSGAWKSCVVLAGSILEAILLDVLSHPKRVAKTNQSPKGARARGHAPIPIGAKWKLQHLIDVAADTGVLPNDRADTVHQVLRDYRNFIHPSKELAAGYSCDEAEAFSSIGALAGVCNHFDKTL